MQQHLQKIINIGKSARKKHKERDQALVSQSRVLLSISSWPQQLDQRWATFYTGGATMGSMI